MVGIIVELAISWLLLWLFAKTNLEALGLLPSKNRLINVAIGLLLSGICCILYHVLKTYPADNGWILNKQISFVVILKSTWWTFKSVLFEELIFRGAILYLLTKVLSVKTACILSAVSFGIYHLFSYNAFGNPVQMVIVFLMTAILGLALAYSFTKTQSLYLPVSLHFGWNYFNIVVFSSGPLGSQLFIKANTNKLQDGLSLAILVFQTIALPLLIWWYLSYISRKPKQI
ncbi:CPBP family intramembrane metalloprotease [Elizabethkingia sp. HX XZB]|uniref:CPBP family intramembrane glutamic endopeptidase n=1 Tax=Elizabethkingia sp. HX XZB TaxID=3003193 RepID=UPI002A23E109|nr:CPBP family intramembrane glutamic endopeptidase [Elizabethkingia sp. HX XZB]MDX8568919.1 CPBP family intramembrane metalloprotease [Elizabethkingia sp. HX XZB]